MEQTVAAEADQCIALFILYLSFLQKGQMFEPSQDSLGL